MERAGRLDIARGLLEEVLELDLRRVQPNVRFELRRRRQTLAALPESVAESAVPAGAEPTA